jgi:hypothetical protein
MTVKLWLLSPLRPVVYENPCFVPISCKYINVQLKRGRTGYVVAYDREGKGVQIGRVGRVLVRYKCAIRLICPLESVATRIHEGGAYAGMSVGREGR